MAEPDFYGLKFAQQIAGGTVVPLDFAPGAVNATAYACVLPSGQQAVAIVNKDEHQALHIDLPGFSLANAMTAPSLTARSAQFDEPQSYREVSTVAAASAVFLLSTRG